MPKPNFVSFAALTALFVAARWQDPPPAKEPAPAPAPVAKPIPGVPERHPLEGVWELRRRIVAGKPEPRPSHGYVAITRQHMFLCLIGPSNDADHPLLRAGVRTWSMKRENMETVVKLGWFTDSSGALHVEPPGTAELRQVALERGVLRFVQDGQNELEFERVE